MWSFAELRRASDQWCAALEEQWGDAEGRIGFGWTEGKAIAILYSRAGLRNLLRQSAADLDRSSSLLFVFVYPPLPTKSCL